MPNKYKISKKGKQLWPGGLGAEMLRLQFREKGEKKSKETFKAKTMLTNSLYFFTGWKIPMKRLRKGLTFFSDFSLGNDNINGKFIFSFGLNHVMLNKKIIFSQTFFL